jgi:thioredoxin-related protein
MKRIYTFLLVLVLASGIMAFTNVSALDDSKKGKTPKAESIKWMTIKEAEASIKKEPRKIFIDVYTDWCGWCKKMDKDTFSDPEIAAYVNKHYYAVKLDAEGKEPITVKGHTYTFKPEYKSHELALALLNGQMSYPTTVYLDEKMNMLSPVPGYLDKATFTKIIRYFGDNHHKNMTWQEYEKKK